MFCFRSQNTDSTLPQNICLTILNVTIERLSDDGVIAVVAEINVVVRKMERGMVLTTYVPVILLFIFSDRRSGF